MDTTLIHQGVDLMLFGMGTVFVFLTVLIFSTTAMSFVVSRFFPEAIVAEKTFSPVKSVESTNTVDPKVLTVIQDAIEQHRAKA